MNKILLIGSIGQVGWELHRTLMTLGTVIPANRHSAEPYRLDLAQPDTIRTVIRELQPNLVVNAAAYTAVDQAESEPDLAMIINGIAPSIIAEEAKRCKAGIVHYSTDYVFNGSQIRPYTEDDPTDPQSVYGATKLAGEQAVTSVSDAYLILRTSWVYGLHGKNFLLTMLRLAQEREEIKVVDDQVGSPTWSRMIAEATAQIVSQGNPNLYEFLAEKYGIYHLTSTSQISWYGFAKAIFEISKSFEREKLRTLTPILSNQYPSPVQRPAYSCLDTCKVSKTFGLMLPHWNNALELALSGYDLK
jgi:dTDP-4-dehydrorhamnose reductase